MRSKFFIVALIILFFNISIGNVSGSIPKRPGSCLKYHVPGAKHVTFIVDYYYPDVPEFSKNFNVNRYDLIDGCLYLEPGSETFPVIVRVTAQDEMGEKSDTFTFTSKEWWSSIKNSERNHALEHTFLILNKPKIVIGMLIISFLIIGIRGIVIKWKRYQSASKLNLKNS